MSIFNVFSLIGGLALFLYGMNVMGDGLTKAAGSRLERILEKLTSSPVKGVLLGALVTAVIQSSSATTVMVVGFVNSGIMKLRQAVGVIMGANIGTTITSWILSLSGIEGDNIFIKMLKPSSFSPILAAVGVILIMFFKGEKKRNAGQILIGFAILMFGMETMSDAVSPLADVPEFTNILLMFSNPVLGMLAGALLTAVIQSSSASVGILQALCLTGAVTYSSAIPIIMGQNIGTCVTALLSSVGAKKNAKRAAFVHLYFNVIGTLLFMIVFYTVNSFVDFSFMSEAAGPAGIAVVHTVFNLAAAICLLPFGRLLEKLATLTIRDEEKKDDMAEALELEPLKHLDVRFLEQPAFAASQSLNVMTEMAKLSSEALGISLSLLDDYTDEKYDRVENLEKIVDIYEDELGTYMVSTSEKELSVPVSRAISTGLHCIGDLERISDHAISIAVIYSKLNKGKIKFSEKAVSELGIYAKAINEIMELTVEALEKDDMNVALRIEALEDVINDINADVKKHHIKRLQKGKCSVETGISFENVINNYENVADHCSNVAVTLLQSETDSFDTHEYLKNLKQESNVEFHGMYLLYKEKYSL